MFLEYFLPVVINMNGISQKSICHRIIMGFLSKTRNLIFLAYFIKSLLAGSIKFSLIYENCGMGYLKFSLPSLVSEPFENNWNNMLSDYIVLQVCARYRQTYNTFSLPRILTRILRSWVAHYHALINVLARKTIL